MVEFLQLPKEPHTLKLDEATTNSVKPVLTIGKLRKLKPATNKAKPTDTTKISAPHLPGPCQKRLIKQ